MRFEIDPPPLYTPESFDAFRVFANVTPNMKAANNAAAQLLAIAKVVADSSILAGRAAVRPDGAEWLGQLTDRLALLHGQLIAERHSFDAMRAQDNKVRLGLDGRAAELVTLVQRERDRHRAVLNQHASNQQDLRFNLGRAGMTDQEIDLAVANRDEGIADWRPAASKDAIADCEKTIAVLDAFLADPVRDRRVLSAELLDQLKAHPQRALSAGLTTAEPVPRPEVAEA